MATSTPLTAPRRGSSAWMYCSASLSVLYIFQLPAISGVRAAITRAPASRPPRAWSVWHASAPPSARHPCAVERLHAGQRFALDQLQGGAAAGREVIHRVLQPELRERRRGVAATDDGQTGGPGDGLRHGERAGGEGLELEGTHGAVPEDGAGLRDHFGVARGGGGSDVKAHPAVGHFHPVELPGRGLSRELLPADQVVGQLQVGLTWLGCLTEH